MSVLSSGVTVRICAPRRPARRGGRSCRRLRGCSSTQGYGATTIDAIAEAAGVSRKTVFSAVGGKWTCSSCAGVGGRRRRWPVALVDRDAMRKILSRNRSRRLIRGWAAVQRLSMPVGALVSCPGGRRGCQTREAQRLVDVRAPTFGARARSSSGSCPRRAERPSSSAARRSIWPGCPPTPRCMTGSFACAAGPSAGSRNGWPRAYAVSVLA